MSDLKAKQSKLQELREEAKNFAEVNFSEMDADAKEKWSTRNEELETLSNEIKEQQIFEKQKADNEAAFESGKEVASLPIHEEKKVTRQSLADMVIESKAYQSYKNDGMLNIKSEIKWNPFMETKTLLTESGYHAKNVIDLAKYGKAIVVEKPMALTSNDAQRMIGHGSFGAVFLAKVVETGEVVAIKKVLQDRRFKNRELQIMRQVT